MQKFVTIYLDVFRAARKEKLYKHPLNSPNRVIEHLGEYLDEGWRIKKVQAFGYENGGWFGVVLEKHSE
jgi:hypothetical protein